MSGEGSIQDVLEGRARWCVVAGDCAEVLQTFPVADAIISDPPYGIGEARGRAKTRGNRKTRHLVRDYGDSDWDDAPPSGALIDLVRSRGRRVVLFGGNYFDLPPSKCWLVWDKLNGDTDFADCELAWTNLDKAVRRIAYRWNGYLRENGEERGQHPTQKPVGVMLWAIGHALPEGHGLVVDPFCGSGTTGVAALRLGHRFIGIERDAAYAAVARERLMAEEQGLTLGAARAGQKSLFGGMP